MLRLKYWLSRLGVWLWLRYGGEKIHIAFRHTECGSEVVQLAEFRPPGAEFQCFKCSALIPIREITFRILEAEEMEKIRKRAETEEKTEQDVIEYFESAVLPHIVTV